MGVSRQEGSAYMDDASERAIEEDMLDQSITLMMRTRS